MKRIEVTIEGTSPILMHNIGMMALQEMGKRVKKKTDIPTSENEAEDSAYRMKSGELYIPARAIKMCIINASGWFKVGRTSAKQFIAGGTRIEPIEVPLGTKEYEIDIRPVVIQGRSRVLRSRPTLKEWKATFSIIYNEQIFNETTILKQIVEEAGIRIGLLDNRPQKGGENGTFRVLKWKDNLPIQR